MTLAGIQKSRAGQQAGSTSRHLLRRVGLELVVSGELDSELFGFEVRPRFTVVALEVDDWPEILACVVAHSQPGNKLATVLARRTRVYACKRVHRVELGMKSLLNRSRVGGHVRAHIPTNDPDPLTCCRVQVQPAHGKVRCAPRINAEVTWKH